MKHNGFFTVLTIILTFLLCLSVFRIFIGKEPITLTRAVLEFTDGSQMPSLDFNIIRDGVEAEKISENWGFFNFLRDFLNGFVELFFVVLFLLYFIIYVIGSVIWIVRFALF